MKKYYIITLLFLVISITSINATPYAFLNYEIGISGLNKTGSVSSESGEAVVYNPALLINNKNEFVFTYIKPFSSSFISPPSETIENINLDKISIYSFGGNISTKKNGIGFNLFLLKNDDLMAYDEKGNLISSFSTYQGIFTLGYGFLIKDLYIGINNKIIYQKLYDSYNKSLGVLSLGLKKILSRKLFLTTTLNNLINYKISSENMTYETPVRNYTIGLNYRIGRLNIKSIIWSDLKDIRISSEAEVKILNWITFFGGLKDGAGYFSNYNNISALNNYSIINTGFKIYTKNWKFGYGLGYQNSLGIKHIFTLYYNY